MKTIKEGHTMKARCKDCKWVHEADSVKQTSFMGVGLCSLHASVPALLEACKEVLAWASWGVPNARKDEMRKKVQAIVDCAEGRGDA